jgi:hypothetical protein
MYLLWLVGLVILTHCAVIRQSQRQKLGSFWRLL